MRKVILLLMLSIFVSATSFAQTQAKDEVSESKCKAREFLNGRSYFLVKEFFDLQKIGGVECQVLIMNKIVSGEKIGCLRLETQYKLYSDNIIRYTGFIDYDELDACIQSLEYIKNTLLPSAPKVSMKADYTTKDGVYFGVRYNNRKWTPFVYTSFDKKSECVLDVENIDSLIAVMHQAKSMIAEKTK